MRKEILPVWIRFFAWIYIFMFLCPLVFVAGFFENGSVSFMGFGLDYEGSTSWHPTAVFLTAIFTLSASVAYGILWGKDWAIWLGILYGWIALATCVTALILSESYGRDYFPVEPFFLVPFLVTLHRKKSAWDHYGRLPPNANTVEQGGGADAEPAV